MGLLFSLATISLQQRSGPLLILRNLDNQILNVRCVCCRQRFDKGLGVIGVLAFLNLTRDEQGSKHDKHDAEPSQTAKDRSHVPPCPSSSAAARSTSSCRSAAGC